MIHQDFYKKYIDIRLEEVNALNEAIRNTDDKECIGNLTFLMVSIQNSPSFVDTALLLPLHKKDVCTE